MEQKKESVLALVPAIRMILSENALKSGSFVLLDQLTERDPEKITIRLGRTISVFRGEPEELLKQIEASKADIGEYIFIEELGLLGLSSNKSKVEQKLATVRKEGRGAGLPEAVASPQSRKPLYNKVIAITGGAMGFGEGIARQLFGEGANVVIMDINRQEGTRLAGELNQHRSPNRAWFIEADVSSLESMEQAVYETVLEFGGLDVMISNAGVLRAGAIDELEESEFDLVTGVNYKGYYNSVKAVVPVMKLQNRFSGDNYGDIIQINSKSGLEGSKKNFAYSGSKFAGIGLTHSFAMELIGDRIKVNAICPGNYFEGPLWSDPEKGLFVQYLKAAKVSGAKTIMDVKRHYESMVPAGRGCRVEDVVKAIKYVIDQEYETGQAIPVTGGQVMLS
ncbi:MAG: SDR family NAD(P)-dependent oxidoreductase [Bacteroidales bacterium]|nr:SDR family NAD(P)-dependent oxidoreductase [Bacteroidales bacterium]